MAMCILQQHSTAAPVGTESGLAGGGGSLGGSPCTACAVRRVLQPAGAPSRLLTTTGRCARWPGRSWAPAAVARCRWGHPAPAGPAGRPGGPLWGGTGRVGPAGAGEGRGAAGARRPPNASGQGANMVTGPPPWAAPQLPPCVRPLPPARAPALTWRHRAAHGVGPHQAQRGGVAKQGVARLGCQPPPGLVVLQADRHCVARAAGAERRLG